jgi:hypothetical protein
MLKRLIIVTFFFYALTSFAQNVAVDRLQSDTLIDTAFSYHHLLPIPDNFNSKGNFYKDYLNGGTVHLKIPGVRPCPATYEQFKKEFLELEVEDPLANLDLHLPSPEEMRMLACQGGIVMPGPISILYDQFSKEARSKEIYAGLMKKDEAALRYNDALITKLTGIKDKDEIQKFMDFCAIQIQFILKSSDYELYAAIMDCYGEFCKTGTDTVAPGE